MKEDTARPFPEQDIGHTDAATEMSVSCPESPGTYVLTVFTGQTTPGCTLSHSHLLHG